MSTDSTELTFIRCPSCRSLVPAVSTRCRMCGVTLEGQGGSSNTQGSGEEKKSGRVRQHTMAAPRGTAPTPENLSKPVELAPVNQLEELDENDPLRDYVEEIDDIQNKQPLSAQEQTSEELEDPLFGDDDSEEEDILSDDDFDDFLDDDDITEEDISEEEIFEDLEEEEELQVAPEPRKVVVESGSGKTGGLFFAQPEENKTEPKESEVKESGQKPFERKESTGKNSLSAPSVTPKASKAVVSRTPTGNSSLEVVMPQDSGKLYGWLVNYSNPNGSSYEIREGRFFISSTEVKGNDLLVGHDSISAPHAILTVSLSEGLLIQDLMSENGVFIQKRGEGSFEQYEQIASLAHGDILKLGEVEFLVNVNANIG